MTSQRDSALEVSSVEPTAQRWTDWLFSIVWLRLAFFLAVVHEAVPYLFSNARHLLEYMDDHQFYTWELANKITVLRYHQLPAWNPYWCGGTLGVAAPEDIFFAPDNLLRLFFDVGIARHWTVILGMVLAAEGTFRLARVSGSSGVASMFAALIYAINTVFPSWVSNGFFNFIIGFGLMPWVAWCLIMGIEARAYRLLGGFFLAWIFLSAGTYPAPYTLMLVGVLTVSLSLAYARRGPGEWRRPFESAIVLGVVFTLLACAKFVPLMLFLKQFSRTWNPVEAYPAAQILGNFSVLHTPVLVLACLAPLTRDRWAIIFTIAAGLFFVMAMGDFDPMSPYHLIKQVPLFKQLRSPERHVVLVFLCLALSAARMITAIEDFVPQVFARWIARKELERLPALLRHSLVAVSTLVLIAAIAPRLQELIKQCGAQYNTVVFSVEPPLAYEQQFRQHRGNRRDGHLFPLMNMGSIYCITGIPVPESPALRGDLPAEEYPQDPTAATVRRVSWSPNEIELDVDASRPTRVLVNQNFHSNWRSSIGTTASHQGLLGVDVPRGHHRLRLRFVDRALQASVAVSLLTLLALASFAAYAFAKWARRWTSAFRSAMKSEPTP